MLEKIKYIQEIKVDELLALIKEEGEKQYTLKAPTGSGKTYMQGYLISKLIEMYPNCKIIYQSLSKASLAQQAFNKITVDYNFPTINAKLLSTDKTNQETLTIPLNYNTYFLPKDLNKKDANLEIPLKNFLTYQTKDNQKFLILDECHITSNNIMKYENEFDYIFGFSATPTKEQTRIGRYVELDEETCEEYNLIKKRTVVRQLEINDNLKLRIKNALDDFKQIQNDYKDSGINPALIIQISNKFKGQKQKEEIIEVLNENGYLWYYDDSKGFESSDKINELKGINSKEKARKYVVLNSSTIPVIIFKLTYTEGFDIPRACYLLQIRETESETLDEQVVGRIRRNPCLFDFDSLPKQMQEKLMIAYVNGVEQQETRQVKYVKRNDIIEVETTHLINKIPKKLQDIKNLDLKEVNQPHNIFKLKENWDLLDSKIKNNLQNISKDEWIKYCINVEILNKNSYIEDYENNIKSSGKQQIQEETFYRVDPEKIDIDKWVWKHSNSSVDKCYSFESSAEKTIARELSKLNLELWGKNFFNKSKIYFEYFLQRKGKFLISNQYPDFIVVNNKKTYLIEVKSNVLSTSKPIGDPDDYQTKINSIKSIYKESSKITNQIFVLINQLQNGEWISHVYEKGKETNYYNDDKLNFLNN